MIGTLQGSGSNISTTSGSAQVTNQQASARGFSLTSSLSGNLDILENLVNQYLKLLGKYSGSSSYGKPLTGTRRDDTLNGTASGDRIYGRAGNDILNGNGGNDQLYGEAGNDQLNGGEGDDYLEDNDGSNTFVGGAGNDTVRFKGKVADYDVSTIQFIQAPDADHQNGLVLRDKRSGEEQTVFSVETFRFNDATLDVKELLNQGTTDPARQAYETNLQKWQGSGIDDYSFTLQRSCFCPGDTTKPVNINVENGQVVSATFADTGEPLPADLSYNSLTIDDLFKQVGDALDSGAERVDVTYDPTYGYPTSIYIDRSSRIADEEVGFTVSNFQQN